MVSFLDSYCLGVLAGPCRIITGGPANSRLTPQGSGLMMLMAMAAVKKRRSRRGCVSCEVLFWVYPGLGVAFRDANHYSHYCAVSLWVTLVRGHERDYGCCQIAGSRLANGRRRTVQGEWFLECELCGFVVSPWVTVEAQKLETQ